MAPARLAADRLVAEVAAGGLLAAGRPVLVLLSGGRDSVCLLDVAVRVAGAAAVSALHVNHGLRADAAEDERCCGVLARRLGVTLDVVRLRRPASAGNVQGWARGERYRAARELAAARGGIDVATGHTASDQAETVLYRLAASPGRRALLGMAPRTGAIVRPLLGLTRGRVTAYCAARGLGWRDDPSNADPRFARSRARSQLVSALCALHPGAERNVARTTAALRAESEALDALLDAALGPGDVVPLARLSALAPALRAGALRRLAERSAGAGPPVTPAAVEALLARAARGGCTAADLGGGRWAHAEYGRLRVAREAPDAPPPPPAPLTVPGRARFGAWELRCELAGPGAEALGERGRPPAGWPPARELVGALDPAPVGARAIVRARRPGDRIVPLGLGGSRRLQDLLVDRKVPRRQRVGLPVLEVGGRIAWVAGVATAEPFRVRPGGAALLVTARHR